jgi:hypothetical protein
MEIIQALFNLQLGDEEYSNNVKKIYMAQMNPLPSKI